MASRKLPTATYRLQFRGGMGFSAARGLVPYLDGLGISHLYASPLFVARPGSVHGYDVIDPGALDPTLGTTEEFNKLVEALHEREMGLVLDIVPNHLAMDPANALWMDVLEHGRLSRFASSFDIRWMHTRRHGDILLLPVLAGSVRECLEAGSLSVELKEAASDGEDALKKAVGPAIFIRHFDQRFPVPATAWTLVLGSKEAAAEPLSVAARRDPKVLERLRRHLARFEGEAIAPKTRLLRRLMAPGPFRLVASSTTGRRFAYRRFFDINDLVGVRVEEEGAFAATHCLVLELAASDRLDGLRVDHIDGLRDPENYLRRLRTRLAEVSPPADEELRKGHGGTADARPFYVVVEKILAPGEELRPEWPVDGTTGYDFLNSAERIFIDPAGLARLGGEGIPAGSGLVPPGSGPISFADLAYAAKKEALENLFGGDVRYLTSQLRSLVDGVEGSCPISPTALGEALVEITCSLRVYRTYIRDLPPNEQDLAVLRRAEADAEGRSPRRLTHALDYVRRLLSLDPQCPAVRERPEKALDFVLSWQQLTGPVAAKGVEDTAFYRDARLISLDEVGSDTLVPCHAVERLHSRNHKMKQHWPAGLNATSTHDSKRSEDVRSRLDVLTEIPDDWAAHVDSWRSWNADKRTLVNGSPVPDPEEEMLVYQTLVGCWPVAPNAADADNFPFDLGELTERVESFLTKALREAKVHSGWRNPHRGYEDGMSRFIGAIMQDRMSPFLADLRDLSCNVAWFGALNSVGQVLLKVASPGVPDFYQGSELWDLSLVDPDNRRPVDFELRGSILEELQTGIEAAAGSRPRSAAAGKGSRLAAAGKESRLAAAGKGSRLAAAGKGPRPATGSQLPSQDFLSRWKDGRIKFLVTMAGLNCRRADPDLFHRGDYLPLDCQGFAAGHIVAVARRHVGRWVLVAIPRLMTRLVGFPALPTADPAVWRNTSIRIPDDAPDEWRNLLTGRTIRSRYEEATGLVLISAREAFADLPWVLLHASER
ncbi:MAG: malto-oligosyltrehalose synthase [Actinobacteria bacterium]|nr:malto-oligosyltrehalose synthase [Actinomycetota bacterium]